MFLEELFEGPFLKSGLHKIQRKFDRTGEDDNYNDIHADDPERKAWHQAGGNIPGYGPDRIADHQAALQVGTRTWNSMTDEEKTQWHIDNPPEDPSLPPPPTLAQRQAETARLNAMSPEEREAEEKRTRAEYWERKNKAQQEAKAKIEAERKRKAEEKRKAQEKAAAELEKNGFIPG